MEVKPKRGRPAGSGGKTWKRERYVGRIPEILDALLLRALGGDPDACDPAAARTFLSFVAPQRPLSATVSLPLADDPTEQAAIILSAALSGRISPDSADSLISTLLTKARLTEVSALEERVAHLQKTLDDMREKLK